MPRVGSEVTKEKRSGVMLDFENLHFDVLFELLKFLDLIRFERVSSAFDDCLELRRKLHNAKLKSFVVERLVVVIPNAWEERDSEVRKQVEELLNVPRTLIRRTIIQCSE